MMKSHRKGRGKGPTVSNAVRATPPVLNQNGVDRDSIYKAAVDRMNRKRGRTR